MNFLSKDAPLQESIKAMQDVLAEVGCITTCANEKHPLEHCYSVILKSTEAPDHIYANGKGIVAEASMASALGEYIERMQTNNFFMDFHLPERQQYPDQIICKFDGDYLNKDLRLFYDPDGELTPQDLVDYNSDYESQIVALPFIQQKSQETVYIPLNILNNLYVSNGLASGNTPHEAQVQALSEIFERYVKTEIIKNGYGLPKYPDEIIRSFPRLHRDIATLQESGYIIEVLDGSLGGKYPVTAISLINPENASLFVSFGAHPILEVALERTMTELMQGRGLENLDTFEVPTFDMDVVTDSFNLESHFIDSSGKIGFAFLSKIKSFPYTSYQYQGNGCADEYHYLADILHKMNKEIYLRQYNYLGFYSCQMIVPGISEIYPVDDLLYNNRNQGKWIRDMVLHFQEHQPQEILKMIHSLDDGLQVDTYIGVIFRNRFTILEFKAQMHLLLDQMEEALAFLEFGENKLGHIIAELIRMNQEQLIFAEYKDGLGMIFGAGNVDKAMRILKGEEFLIDTTLHQDYHNILAMYDRLEQKKQPFNRQNKDSKIDETT